MVCDYFQTIFLSLITITIFPSIYGRTNFNCDSSQLWPNDVSREGDHFAIFYQDVQFTANQQLHNSIPQLYNHNFVFSHPNRIDADAVLIDFDGKVYSFTLERISECISDNCAKNERTYNKGATLFPLLYNDGSSGPRSWVYFVHSAEWIGPTSILNIRRATDDCKKPTDNGCGQDQQVILDNRHQLISVANYTKPSFPPNAIAKLNSTHVHAFFRDFVGIYKVQHDHAMNFNAKINHQMSSHWIGCPTEFCFESDVDAAIMSPDYGIRLFRGRYLYAFKNLDGSETPIVRRSATLSANNLLHETVDAAFTCVKSDYFIHNRQYFRTGDDDIFPQL